MPRLSNLSTRNDRVSSWVVRHQASRVIAWPAISSTADPAPLLSQYRLSVPWWAYGIGFGKVLLTSQSYAIPEHDHRCPVRAVVRDSSVYIVIRRAKMVIVGDGGGRPWRYKSFA
jgi:hypothetical protein